MAVRRFARLLRFPGHYRLEYSGAMMLAQNVRQNFELLYARRDMLPLVSNHRTRVFEAIMAGEPEQAREAIPYLSNTLICLEPVPLYFRQKTQ